MFEIEMLILRRAERRGFSQIDTNQWRIQNYPEGCQQQRWWRKPTNQAICSRKLHEIENYLDPPLSTTTESLSITQCNY